MSQSISDLSLFCHIAHPDMVQLNSFWSWKEDFKSATSVELNNHFDFWFLK